MQGRKPYRSGLVVRSIWNMTRLHANSTIGRIIRLPLNLIPAGTDLRILRGPLKGAHWISDSSNATCWMGIYEHKKQQAFEKWVKGGQVVFDLGANVGFYSLLSSRIVGETGRVIAFEPARRNIPYLRRHLEMNDIHNCAVFESAVSSEEGQAYFEASDLPVTGHIAATSSNSNYQVSTVVLDKLVSDGKVPKPHLIKCDIEGAELKALRGARETLLNCRPVILLSTHGDDVHASCCGLLRELRYRIEPLEEGVAIAETDELVALPVA